MTKDGFYVRMKHKNTSRNGTVWYLKRFKWLIWISLALYFLTSYLITKTTSLHITTVHGGESEIISRALIESVNTTSFSNQSIAFTSASGPRKVNDLKIYVYDLPPRYNLNWLANQRCSSHLFAAEVAIHKAILNSETRTFDPWGADFFFVPVYVSCNFSTVNGFPAIAHARPLLASAVQLISSQLSFWNRSDGADHVLVASHDYGSCFHAMEDKAVENGVPEFLKKSIILQTFGVKYHHPCQEVTNVVIPPYVSPEKLQRTLAGVPANGQRDIWAFFRGKMEVHPKNISGRFYSKRVRTVIWERFGRDRRFYLKRHRFKGYQSEIARSTFCLCPLGWAPWSPRLVESVVLGCVPVIIADGIRLPFESAIPWSDISLTVAEKDVGKLAGILDHVAATNLSSIQRNLWNASVRNALLFHDEIVEGDATWHVFQELFRIRNRSLSRVRMMDISE
ncbi:unnamed protein product [Rhodiola kirilowii]